MPNSTNEASPNGSFRRGFKTDAERIAIVCRKNLGLKDHDPLPSFLLAEYLKLRIIKPSELGLSASCLNELVSGHSANCWSAITIGRSTPELIIYNESHSTSRTESNIMHELAHILLKHEMCEIDLSYGIPLRKYDGQQEIEAEWLGGCLQLPKAVLMKYFIYQSLSEQAISEKFNASISMVNYRVRVSGVKLIKARYSK